jgi:hypothetical protein
MSTCIHHRDDRAREILSEPHCGGHGHGRNQIESELPTTKLGDDFQEQAGKHRYGTNEKEGLCDNPLFQHQLESEADQEKS